MLALIAAERTLDALPIMKWILAQQSATGGFGSTQNTVIELFNWSQHVCQHF